MLESEFRKHFLNYVITRSFNPNVQKMQWSICKRFINEIGPPIVWGVFIQDVIRNFKKFIEGDEE